MAGGAWNGANRSGPDRKGRLGLDREAMDGKGLAGKAWKAREGRIGAAGEGWDGMNRTRAEATGLDWQVRRGPERNDQERNRRFGQAWLELVWT